MESSIWSDDQPSLREMHDQDQITTITPQAPQSKGSSNDVISQRTQGQAPKQLACVSCRRKKVKCRPGSHGSGSCSLCQKLQIECDVPDFDERRRAHSRKVIEDLRAEVARLKAELEEHRSFCLMGENNGSTEDGVSDWLSEDQHNHYQQQQQSDGLSPPSSCSVKSDNMIVRLCGGQRQLNSDRGGRLRFFGPTSSLHLMESVTSSVLIRESNGTTCRVWQDDFPLDVQNYLLDLYWTYQHQVCPCIHKQAFLRDMENGDTKYCSTLLLYCMLTRAAAISNQPGLRALALADDAEDDPPYLVRKCVQLLETELDNPGITTAQSLQLLSEMHCAISSDTKGWMYAGGAGRLAYELGLHSNSEALSANLSELDLEVRQITFWSCFNLDRAWALYLGRPQCIKLEDIDVKRPGEGHDIISAEMKMSAAWTNLLEIIGLICEILNGVHTPRHHMNSVDQRLRQWHSELDPSLRYHPKQMPAVFLLHMQYSAAMILLHRPLAQFGKDASLQSSASEISRQVCIDHACAIAQFLQEYHDEHGSVLTMSWIALHIIATASTTLIANVAERGRTTVVITSVTAGVPAGLGAAEHQLTCLRKCLDALSELEKSHVVTRRVRKVIQHAIRLLNLDATINPNRQFGTGAGVASASASASAAAAAAASLPTPLSAASFASAATPSLDLQSFPFLDLLLPAGSQFDRLNSFESYFS